MTTSTKDALWPTLSDNAQYNNFCQQIYDLLIAIGLTQTADTGQTANPVAVGFPSAGVFNVKWVFRFNDSSQSSAPIYMLFEFGRGTAVTNAIWRITYGTGTNGASGITGAVQAAATIGNTSWQPSQTKSVRMQGCYNTAVGAFWLAIDTAEGGATTPAVTFAGRTINTSGVPTTDGWVALTHVTSGSIIFGSYELAIATVRVPIGLYPSPWLTDSVSSASIDPTFDGETLYVYPPQLQVQAEVKQLGGFYGTGKSAFHSDTVVPINQFGTERSYKMVGIAGNVPCGWDYNRKDHSGPLLIWE